MPLKILLQMLKEMIQFMISREDKNRMCQLLYTSIRTWDPLIRTRSVESKLAIFMLSK